MDVPPPALAAALHALGELDPRQRPMLAAHWVAAGLGGAVLADLAGLRGDEREVSDLWPGALAEVGVLVPLRHVRRTAMAALAARVTAGERDVRWLRRVLWPSFEREGAEDVEEADSTDDALDEMVYGLDVVLDVLDLIDEPGGELGRRHVPARRAHLDAAVAAMARDDVDGAVALLAAAASPERRPRGRRPGVSGG